MENGNQPQLNPGSRCEAGWWPDSGRLLSISKGTLWAQRDNQNG